LHEYLIKTTKTCLHNGLPHLNQQIEDAGVDNWYVAQHCIQLECASCIDCIASKFLLYLIGWNEDATAGIDLLSFTWGENQQTETPY
jgi:hypothetical protein